VRWVRVSGRVVVGPYGGTSKSARGHQAFLECDDGTRYRLRRLGGHAMRDPRLESLEGTRVLAEGRLHGLLFLARRIEPEPDAE
jgi:hypothetical protein